MSHQAICGSLLAVIALVSVIGLLVRLNQAVAVVEKQERERSCD